MLSFLEPIGPIMPIVPIVPIGPNMPIVPIEPITPPIGTTFFFHHKNNDYFPSFVLHSQLNTSSFLGFTAIWRNFAAK